MWKDLTYPLFGQFLFTDGQDYSFMNYQLNTIRLWNNAQSYQTFLILPFLKGNKILRLSVNPRALSLGRFFGKSHKKYFNLESLALNLTFSISWNRTTVFN